jgi:hypothetical protein
MRVNFLLHSGSENECYRNETHFQLTLLLIGTMIIGRVRGRSVRATCSGTPWLLLPPW